MKISKLLSLTTVVAAGTAGCFSLGAVNAAPNSNIHLGESKSVFLIADGKGKSITTRVDTVKELLNNEKITLKGKDTISAKLDSKIIDKEFLVVKRITEKNENKEIKKINYKITKSKTSVDCQKPTDKTKITTKGVNGSTKVVIKHDFVNGILMKSDKVKEITTKPVDQVVANCKPKAKNISKVADKKAKDDKNKVVAKVTLPTSAPSASSTAPVVSPTATPKEYKIVKSDASSNPTNPTSSATANNASNTITITSSEINALVNPSYNVNSSPTTIDVNTKVAWMKAAGIDPSDFAYANYIITHESSWQVNAQNPTSPAYGLPQCYYPSMMASEGSDWRTNPVTQLKWFKKYANERYHGIKNAYQYWIVHNNY